MSVQAPGAAVDVYPSFLSIFIDCIGIKQGYTESDISNLTKVIILYIHSYALLHRQNQICVMCNQEGGEGFEVLFPPRDAAGNFLPSSIHQLLTILNEKLTLELFSSVASSGSVVPAARVVSLTNPISRMLCCINKQVSVNPKLQPRILVIQRLLDNPAEYNSFMNCIFSAQKLHCLMDGLLLSSNSESSVLQQACHLTGGTYSRYTVSNEFSQLLLVLLHKFLASACTRKFLAIPVQDTVSFKASCSCHHRPTEFAFVCTVCLSLTCEVPAADKNGDRVCRACNTTVAAAVPNPKQFK